MQVGGGVEIVRSSGGRGDKYTMSIEEFGILCSAVTRVDVISFASVYGLIVKVTFNTPDQFQLISDITHAPVTELVFKCFIIQDGHGPQPEPIPHVPTHTLTKLIAALTGIKSSSATYSKKSSTSRDADNEYTTQKNIYDTTNGMSNPICPNALGLFKLNMEQFNIIIASKSPFNSNEVFKYLGEQLRLLSSNRRVGILVMESIPSIYHPLKEFTKGSSDYNEMCNLCSAIFFISFALAGYILLDAHTGNWMVAKLPSGKVDAFALDVDKTININDASSLEKLSSYAKKTIEGRYRANLPPTASYLQTPGGIAKTIKDTVAEIKKTRGGPIDIKLIHKIFVLGALSECLSNNLYRDGEEDWMGFDDCKISWILGPVYILNGLYDMDSILKTSIDLEVYLRKKSDEDKAFIIANLQKVSQYIFERTRVRQSRGGATHKPIKLITRRQYKTNRYRRGKKVKKSLKPKHLKRNRRRS
jgi:hypothetical protein